MEKKLPFQLEKSKTFYESLSHWIGDVFYDILPEHGFEVRDEQIFMAYQLDRAYKDKKVLFAEAGVGTGKTLVYLLYSICYARYKGKPAIIACADDLLIEQLMKPNGDLEKLSKALGLKIDARLAKAHDNYLCLNKLDQARNSLVEAAEAEAFEEIYEQLPSFVRGTGTLQSFQHYGDRKDYPHLADEQWSAINWDVFQDCMNCSKRQRCGLTLTRDFYRRSSDLIICSHDYYMEHVWTKDARLREGQLPLLPEASSLVFDEGHLLEDAAQKALSYHFKHSTLEKLLGSFHQQDLRESFLQLVERVYEGNDLFQELLLANMHPVEGSERFDIVHTAALQQAAESLYQDLRQLGDELIIESEGYFLNSYEQKTLEESIDSVELSLKLFTQDEQAITWLQKDGEEVILFIMPRTVAATLQEYVFAERTPVIFSSATLSVGGSFSYIAQSLGIQEFLSFSVESPFDYEQQMRALAPQIFTCGAGKEDWESDADYQRGMNERKAEWISSRLLETGGKTLILFPSLQEVALFKKLNENKAYPFPIYYEGDGERSHMVKLFQEDINSCLCASRLWEGLDIPGESLSHVIIWELPFPPNDPVFQSKRKGKDDPFQEVDLPAMLLRLKQGIGRLIRVREDHGTITILSEHFSREQSIAAYVQQALPDGVRIERE